MNVPEINEFDPSGLLIPEVSIVAPETPEAQSEGAVPSEMVANDVDSVGMADDEASGHLRREARSRSVTFNDPEEDSGDKPRLQRTPTPYWPRKENRHNSSSQDDSSTAEVGDNNTIYHDQDSAVPREGQNAVGISPNNRIGPVGPVSASGEAKVIPCVENKRPSDHPCTDNGNEALSELHRNPLFMKARQSHKSGAKFS